MADNEPTVTVDDGTSENDDPETTAVGEVAAPSGFAFDEQTLGQSESVFDAAVPGVEFVPPQVPPRAPAPMALGEPDPERPLNWSERRRRVRLEARRVRRIVRHIGLWSVLKISLVFHFCLWIIALIAGAVLWSFAEKSGTLESVEDLVESLFALDEEQEFWRGGKIFWAYFFTTLAFSIAGVAFNVLLALLYNVISELTGGLRIIMIEEETARFVPPKRRARR